MARFTYRKTMNKVGKGLLDLSSFTTVKAILIEDGLYTPDEDTHEFLSDVPAGARLSTATLVNYDFGTTKEAEAHADPITFTAPTTGKTVSAVVIYNDTGVEGTSELLTFDDTQAGFPMETDGNNVFQVFNDYIFRVG